MKRLVVALIAANCLLAATPKRDWKTGTLVEMAESREVAGSRPANMVGAGSAMNSQALVYATLIGYVIKGDGMKWMVEVRILPSTLLRHTKRPNVTVNGPLKYSYEKGKFYLQDEDGQEFDMAVMRKEVLPPPSSAETKP